MSIADDIQAQLEELWENADPGPFKEGDAVIINRFGRADFEVRHRVGHDGENLNTRVLERARPEPKAPQVVMAGCVHDESVREAFMPIEDGSYRGWWESSKHVVPAGELVDPVPLVELPDHDVLKDTLQRSSGAMGVAESEAVTGAVLELLRGERKA